MSFLKTLNSIRCCKALLNPAVPSPVFRLPTLLCSQQICAPRKITEFSKKTGDYTSLSAVDIQVMALTYQLEKEHVGSDHIHTEPRVAKVASFSEQLPSAHLGLAGFYMPPQKTNCLEFELERGRDEAVPDERENKNAYKSCFGELEKEIKFMNFPILNVFKTAPEDVEEDEKNKSIYHYGKFQNYLVPEEVEDDEDKAIYLKHEGKLVKNLYVPEDVEEDEKNKSAYLNKKIMLLKHLTVPEDVEEDEEEKVHKLVTFLNHHGHVLMALYPVTRVPEDVEEDEMDKLLRLKSSWGTLLKSSCPATHVPEDVEEDEIHKSFLTTLNGNFPKHLFPINQTAVPEDVEEDEKHKPNNLVNCDGDTRKNLFSLTETFFSVPEDVEDDEPKSFHSLNCNGNLLKCLYPFAQTVHYAPEDVEEEEIYNSTSRKEFLLYSNVVLRKDNLRIHPCVLKM